jgi:hypothetical protein
VSPDTRVHASLQRDRSRVPAQQTWTIIDVTMPSKALEEKQPIRGAAPALLPLQQRQALCPGPQYTLGVSRSQLHQLHLHPEATM